jgi:hypothetical protein
MKNIVIAVILAVMVLPLRPLSFVDAKALVQRKILNDSMLKVLNENMKRVQDIRYKLRFMQNSFDIMYGGFTQDGEIDSIVPNIENIQLILKSDFFSAIDYFDNFTQTLERVRSSIVHYLVDTLSESDMQNDQIRKIHELKIKHLEKKFEQWRQTLAVLDKIHRHDIENLKKLPKLDQSIQDYAKKGVDIENCVEGVHAAQVSKLKTMQTIFTMQRLKNCLFMNTAVNQYLESELQQKTFDIEYQDALNKLNNYSGND